MVFYIIDGRNGEITESPVKQVVETGNTVTLSNHTVLITKSGGRIHIADSAAPIRNENGELDGVVLVIRDQTSEYQKREIIEASVIKYQNLIENLNSAIIVYNPDKSISMCNNNATELFGTDKQSIFKSISNKILCNSNGKHLSEEELPINVVISTLKPIQNSIYGLIDKLTGNITWVLLFSYPEFDQNGKLSKVVLILTDITEQKRSEANLKTSEEKYKTLFYDSPDAYLILDEGKFIECNKSSQNLLRADKDWIIGKTPSEISPENQPNGSKSVELAATLVDIALKNGTHTFEWTHIRKDASEFLAKINLTAMNYNGKLVLFTTWQDITDSRKAEDQLRKLSQAIEQNPISIVITNLDGNIEYANPAACRTTGYSLDELIGKNPRVLKSGATKSNEYENLWKNISTGNEWRGIFQNKRKNGELYWESSTIAPILDSEGKITHYLGIKEDITEQRKIQEALEFSEKRFSEIAESSKTIIWEIDSNGEFKFINSVSESVFGYKPEELINKVKLFDLHPLASQEQSKDFFLNLMINGQCLVNYERQLLTKNNELIWLSTSGTPIMDANNNIIGYRGADNDITDRKIAEEELRKFRIISDQANYGTAIAGLDGTLQYVNPAFARMHGWEVDDLIGKNLMILHSEKHIPRVKELLELIEKNAGFTAEEVWRITKDGREFPSLMNTMLIFDDNNQPQFMSASVLDITELKKAETALKENEEQLNHAQEIAKMGSWEFFVKTGRIVWSQNYYKLIGIDPKLPPLSLDEIKELVHPEDRELFIEKVQLAAKSKELHTFYFRLRINNSTLWIQSNILPIFVDGELVSVRGVSIDITEKIESEKIIREQNDKLNAIISAIPDLIFVINRKGIIEEFYINDLEQSAMPPDKIIGSDISSLFSQEVYNKQMEYFNQCLDNNELITYEYSMPIHGFNRHYESRIVPLENSRVLSFVRDITERKEKEEEIKKLTLAIEQSPVSIVITDLDANILYVSPAFHQTTDYESDEVIGKNTSILKSGRTSNQVYAEMWNNITQGKPWQGEWLNKKKNNELYWESISITPIIDENGKVSSYLAIKQDISERKKLRTRLGN